MKDATREEYYRNFHVRIPDRSLDRLREARDARERALEDPATTPPSSTPRELHTLALAWLNAEIARRLS